MVSIGVYRYPYNPRTHGYGMGYAMTLVDSVQVVLGVTSVVVAALAVGVAWLARGVARDANKISGDVRDTAKDALIATRRQTALGAVPFFTVATPTTTSRGQFRL